MTDIVFNDITKNIFGKNVTGKNFRKGLSTFIFNKYGAGSRELGVIAELGLGHKKGLKNVNDCKFKVHKTEEVNILG